MDWTKLVTSPIKSARDTWVSRLPSDSNVTKHLFIELIQLERLA